MAIQTRPATKEYRDNFDDVFKAKAKPTKPLRCDICDELRPHTHSKHKEPLTFLLA